MLNTCCQRHYFEILLYGLVGDAGLCLCLAHRVVKVLLKVLGVRDQEHGYIIICGALSQTRKDRSDGTHGEVTGGGM